MKIKNIDFHTLFFFDADNENIVFIDAWTDLETMFEKSKWNIFEVISDCSFHKDRPILKVKENYNEMEQLILIMKTKDIYENILFLEMNGY